MGLSYRRGMCILIMRDQRLCMLFSRLCRMDCPLHEDMARLYRVHAGSHRSDHLRTLPRVWDWVCTIDRVWSTDLPVVSTIDHRIEIRC